MQACHPCATIVLYLNVNFVSLYNLFHSAFNIADEEEERVAVITEEVSKKQKDCEEDLIKAEPALVAAQEALNTLNKANLTELKSFGSPPGAVTNVTAAVMVLMAPGGKIPKDRSWKAAKVCKTKCQCFLRRTTKIFNIKI